MRFIYSLIPILIGIYLLFTDGIFKENRREIDPREAEKLIQWAREHLPQTGILKEQPGGFVYLKVDDGYINQLSAKLSEVGYLKPPYFRSSASPGAHISIFYKDERHQTGRIAEIGKTFSFKITHLAFVPPTNRRYLVLQVDSPELMRLREKYGLSPKLKGHDFHITIAEKKSKKHRY
ncbi:MAG: hypothetical protein LLG04_13790 [Parachlamydia sp.]|nr:hypothetical protein [Parachlamydia sp.]